jgi:4-hydroxy-tetrahydrodipicolinate synthase
MFSGSITALVTPFRDNRLDRDAFTGLIEHQIEAGTHGLVICGTTGEVATLSSDEWAECISLAVSVTKGRVPVIAGAGSYDTSVSIARADFAKAEGADAILVVTPYYNKPGQEGLAAHFLAIAEAVAIPMVLYNVPGRTSIDLAPDTVIALSRHPNIVGLKDATGDMGRMSHHAIHCAEGFHFLSGDDASALGFNAHGGHGAISVTSNIAPAKCAAFQNACTNGDWAGARALHEELMIWHELLFAAPSPGPAKWVMARQHPMSAEMRLPLVSPPDNVVAKLERALAAQLPE